MISDHVAERLDYGFHNSDILRLALTHRSFSAKHNERIEFLGDSIVNCIIAHELYQKFPHHEEGDLSRLRALLVNQTSLAAIAVELKLGDHLMLGEGEIKSGGKDRPSILADALESVIGAVFLDGGFSAAQDVVRRIFKGALDAIDPENSGKDAKTQLQELMQGRRLPLPRYDVVAIRGEAHRQDFEVACVIPELNIRCLGNGSSRRRAEQEAARLAYSQAHNTATAK